MSACARPRNEQLPLRPPTRRGPLGRWCRPGHRPSAASSTSPTPTSRATVAGRSAPAACCPTACTAPPLFADISGFTPLTEALAKELGPQRGAEELTAQHRARLPRGHRGARRLRRQRHLLRAATRSPAGSTATTAPGRARPPSRCRRRSAHVGTIVTPGGSDDRARDEGRDRGRADARRFVVGDPDIQLIDVLAGRLIDDLAEAEHHAQKGEIVLDRVGDRGPRRQGRPARARDDRADTCGVARAPARRSSSRCQVVEPAPAARGARPAVAPAGGLRAATTGRGEFLAELRPAYPVFLRFGGIDYDARRRRDRASSTTSSARRSASSTGYGGNVLQLTLGDKGAYLYGVFGSPLAHEDDASRAAAAALELRDLERDHGRARHPDRHRPRPAAQRHVRPRDAPDVRVPRRRREPRRAADVEGAARGGSTSPSAVREAAGEAFIWAAARGPHGQGQGGADRRVRRSTARSSAHRVARLRFELPLVGRRDELARCSRRASSEAVAGQRRVVGIAAEAGMGKSRLVAEFVRVSAAGRADTWRSANASRSGRRRRTSSGARSGVACSTSTNGTSVTRQRNALGRRIAADRSGARRRARRCSGRSSGWPSRTRS